LSLDNSYPAKSHKLVPPSAAAYHCWRTSRGERGSASWYVVRHWTRSRAKGEAMGLATNLVERHVALFNHGVESGDFAPMLGHFEDDATLIFRGIPVGPFHGKAAIAAAYKTQPPTDQIDVLRIGMDGDTIVADYAWRAQPTTRAGQMRFRAENDQISELVIIYEGETPRY
jgi:steroid delta-isomerase